MRTGNWLMGALLIMTAARAEAARDPFYEAQSEASGKVGKAYQAFDYAEVARVRDAFLKTWATKAPAEDRARKALEEAREESAAAKLLAAAWKKVEKAPKQQLVPFLKVRLKHDVRRKYSEEERHGIYDLLQQVSPAARAWTAARFPAVMTGGERLEPGALDTLRTQLREHFAKYGWKLSTSASGDPEKQPRLLRLDADLETSKSFAKVLGSDFGGMQSFPISLRASFEEEGAQIASYMVSTAGTGTNALSGQAAACRRAAQRLREIMADALIDAAVRGEL